MVYYLIFNLASDINIVPPMHFITLTEKISKELDTGKIVCGIFFDFRKAFDVIPHKTLLKKLYSYGIRGNLFRLV